MSQRMRELLRQWADHVTSDNASTDEFLCEGMSFAECIELMDHVALAVRCYAGPPSTATQGEPR